LLPILSLSFYTPHAETTPLHFGIKESGLSDVITLRARSVLAEASPML